MASFPETLPALLGGWVEGLLGRRPAVESRATCDECVMCPGGSPVQLQVFDPRVKCCTYTPELPSFVVGRILRDSDATLERGLRSVEARIAAGVGVTPMGLLRPPAQERLHRTRRPEDMGRSLEMRCPHYVEESGRCGIWQHRNATCATYFCQHDRGMLGYQAWKALRILWVRAENRLTLWCAREAGLELTALAGLVDDPSEPDEAPPLAPPGPAVLERLWGSWAGREAAYYVECADRVDDLDWDTIVRIGGVEVEILARVARAAWQRVWSEELPERLRPGSFQTVALGGEGVTASTYSVYDPIGLPALLLGVLHEFDGRLAAEVLASLRTDRGLELEGDFLRQLVDWGVLIEAES